MEVASLCAGVEGFGLGFERAGHNVVYQCEIDKHCNAVLRRRYPQVARSMDVTDDATSNDVVSIRPDCIIFGFPCQDISVAGRRDGVAGERSGIFFNCMGIVAASAPRWICIENVPGLLSSNAGRDMGTVLGEVERFGYGWAYRVLDSQYFGLAQRRRRVFIVGCLGDTSAAARVLFESESVYGDIAPRPRTKQDVAQTPRPSTQGRGNASADKNGGYPVNVIVSSLDAHMGTGGLDDNAAQAGHVGAGDQTVIPFDTTQITCGDNRSHPRPGDPCHTLSSTMHAPHIAYGGNNTLGPIDVATTRLSHHSRDDFESETFCVHDGVRRLTPRECERLQGYPDDWTRWGLDERGREVELSNSARYRMCGNGVSATVAEWIGRRLPR